MKVRIECLKELFFAVDGEKEYSAVIETENKQVVIYAYNRKSEEIIKALIIPSSLSTPFDLDIKWTNDQCHVDFPNGWYADFDTKTKSGSTGGNFPGDWV